MKKIVSFICVLTMVITLLPLTTNASTNTTTLGLYDSCDCTWIFYQKNSKNFQSSNPNVVKIINNQMLGMVEYYMKAPNCCTLEAQGYQHGFGRTLNQDSCGLIGLLDL